MKEKSAAELERDAEIARAKVADTAESIRNKMSPGQLIDEFTGLFTGGDGAATLANLKAQVRDNPLPLTLVGAGLAWRMLGEGASSTTARGARSFDQTLDSSTRDTWTSDDEYQDDEYQDEEYQGGERTRAGSSIGEALSDAAASVTSVASDAAGAATGTARAARQRLSSAANRYGSGATDMAARAKHSAQDMLQREPLVVAALGLAVGTAIGAMLPRTALEDEQMGRYRDKIRDTAEGMLEKGMEGAKEVAAEAYQTIKEEADRHGLSGGGAKSVVDQVGDVVKSAATRTEEAVREKVAGEPGRSETKQP